MHGAETLRQRTGARRQQLRELLLALNNAGFSETNLVAGFPQ
jgi:hypothetical protein